jgi:hypothetical protein
MPHASDSPYNVSQASEERMGREHVQKNLHLGPQRKHPFLVVFLG